MRCSVFIALALGLASCAPSGAAEHNAAAYSSVSIAPPAYMSPDGKGHYRERVREIQNVRTNGGAVFVGDSLTEGCGWDALLPHRKTQNHGIGWDTSDGVKARLGLVMAAEPDSVYLTVGTNDIGYGHSGAYIASNIADIAAQITASRPQTRVFVGAIPPQSSLQNSVHIRRVNQQIARAVGAMQSGAVQYFDPSPMLAGRNGALQPALTYDGIHLTQAGCAAWAKALPK